MSIFVDICKRFSDFTLNVQFETDGEPLGILGASGSGKSMTLKCVAGLIAPDEGYIKVGDQVVFDSAARINLPPQKRDVGYLFQSYALFPHMTLRRNIAIAACGTKEERGRIADDLIKRYQLTGLEDRYPSHLSGGQQQRAAIARIFASSPRILLLDEPFSALDAFLRESMQMELTEITESYDGDVVLVTHNRDEVFRTCRRLVILHDGHVAAAGELKSVFNNPVNHVAAQVTGCKNISPIRRLAPRTLLATDWGVTLTADRDIEDHHTHVGIRAHDFSAEAGENRFPIKIRKILAGPFEQTVLVDMAAAAGSAHASVPDSAGAPASIDGETNPETVNPHLGKEPSPLWWIISRDADPAAASHLSVAGKDLILLTSFRA